MQRPQEDQALLNRLADDLALVGRQSLPELLPRVDAAVIKLSEYMTALIEQRRSSDGHDLISELVAAHDAGKPISATEAQSLLVTVVWAAQDATLCQLGRALVCFCEHPEQWRLLAAQPDLAPRAVEEVCR